MMTKSDRRPALSTTVFGLVTMLLAALTTPEPAAAASGVPPFCVLRGSTDGPGGSPQVCAYFDYQACLQAAVGLRGNCVQNIDYHGDVSTAPGPARPRHRR